MLKGCKKLWLMIINIVIVIFIDEYMYFNEICGNW